MEGLLPHKTIIFRLSSIGDIVLASPFLRVLRTAAGHDAQIDFVVHKDYADLVRYNPHITSLYEYDITTGFDGLKKLAKILHENKYDFVADIHDSIRTKFLRMACRAADIAVVDKRKLERWLLIHLKRNAYSDTLSVAERYIETLKKYGLQNDHKGLEIFVPDAIQHSIADMMTSLQLQRFKCVVGICPGSKHFTKRWSKEKYADLAVRIAQELNAAIILFGGNEEQSDCRFVEDAVVQNVSPQAVVNTAGKLSLLESTSALKYCDAVVTNDSGLMHIAAAQQRKIVAIFGSTVREFGFAPFETESVIIENNNLACRPCTHIGRSICPRQHLKCLEDITVERVFQEVKEFLR